MCLLQVVNPRMFIDHSRLKTRVTKLLQESDDVPAVP